MVSAANAKKLEKAAATGDPKQLADAMVQAAGKMTKVKKQGPIYQTANELFAQMQGLESTDSLPDGEAGQEVQELDFKMGAPPKIKEPSPLLSQQWIGALEDAAKDGNSSKLQNLTNNLIASTWMPGGSQAKLHEAMRNAQKQLQEQIDDEIMANAVAGGNPTVAYIPVTSAGNEPLVTTAESQQLEAAAATGDKDLIDATAKLLAAKHAVGNYQKGKAILEIGNSLGDQVKAISEEGAGMQPSPGPASDLAAASIGAGDQVAPNNQDVAVGQQAGAATPAWKLLEGPKGSTPGGLYEDQQGNKAYIKVPQSQQHVRNELLAQDLYKLAGVNVLESGEAELQGKPAIASDWSEGFTGSGVNPKGLPGTKERFVADAWLANWDSVGVGSSKYDNILNLDGKAVRVDVGGSLLFRATGGPKGDKFGNVVTEIEGLRDPSLNPVAATVYGDMTPEEINASAQAVVGISDNAIEEAVKARFSDDPALASELAEKLIARRNYISEWVEKNTQPAAQAVSDASADAGEAVAPNILSADAGFEPAAQAVSEAALGTEVAPNPESTDGGRQVGVLKWPKGAPLNLG